MIKILIFFTIILIGAVVLFFDNPHEIAGFTGDELGSWAFTLIFILGCLMFISYLFKNKQSNDGINTWLASILIVVVTVKYSEDIIKMIEGDKEATQIASNKIKDNTDLSGAGVVIKMGANGHFQADFLVNYVEIPMLIDTGATMIALRYEDAEKVGIDVRGLDFSGKVSTANGIARIAPVNLDSVEIDGIVINDLQAFVSEPGALGVNLLGMEFMRRLGSYQVSGDVLILNQ